MPELLVINTGPLITLSRIEALEVVGKLPFHFICPQEVWDELQEGVESGYPIISPSWLHVDPIKTPLTSWMTSTLDKGEAAVIQLALDKNIQSVCIDEWKGRRAAIVAGLKVTGVLGLLGRAKKLGIVDAVKPFINKAMDEGIRYHPDLVQRVLNALDE